MTDPTHAERVAAAVPDHCKVVALLHDAVEDGHLDWKSATSALHPDHATALGLLTRFSDVSYSEYIDNIRRAANGEADRDNIFEDSSSVAGGLIALTVKIADLRDNLNRPEGPPPGDLRGRYEKALAELEGTFA